MILIFLSYNFCLYPSKYPSKYPSNLLLKVMQNGKISKTGRLRTVVHTTETNKNIPEYPLMKCSQHYIWCVLFIALFLADLSLDFNVLYRHFGKEKEWKSNTKAYDDFNDEYFFQIPNQQMMPHFMPYRNYVNILRQKIMRFPVVKSFSVKIPLYWFS